MVFFVNLLLLLACLQNNSHQFSTDEFAYVFNRTNQFSTIRFADSLTIQYFDLRVNPLLFSEAKKYIKEQQDSSLLFRSGYGYIVISDIKSIRNGRPIVASSLNDHVKDIEVEFSIGLSSFYPHQNLGTPLYYSFVEGKLVLIYDRNSEWIHRNRYSVASQRKVKELIKQTLLEELKGDFVFKGLAGDTFVLSAEQRGKMSQEQVFELGSFTLDKLKTVVQYFDGSISYR